MRCKMKYSIILLLFSLISFPIWAQSREGARKQMNQGNYADAITLLSALEEVYPGQFSSDLNVARKCLNLQRTAKKKYSEQAYVDAESLYNQILKLNPNDRNAKNAIQQCQEAINKVIALEYAKCRSIEEYRSFVQKYPNSSQARMANTKIFELGQIQRDERAWETAVRVSTVSAYTDYINHANTKAQYLGEANRNIARIYFDKAITTDNNSIQKDYFFTESVKYYERAQKHKLYLSFEDESKFNAARSEVEFSKLGINPTLYQLQSYAKLIREYHSNSFVYPHLHIEQVIAMFIGAYCSNERYDDARRLVGQYYGSMTSAVYTHDNEKEWTKSDWEKFIKKRERLNRKLKRSSSTQKSRAYSKLKPISNPVSTMFGLGISCNATDYCDDVYIGFEGSFSLGSFSNRFNLEAIAKPSFEYGGSGHFLCPLTIAPRLNICRASSGSFYLYIQPEVGIGLGYKIDAAGIYGGRFGLGSTDLGSIFIEGLGCMKTIDYGKSATTHFLSAGIGVSIYLY